MSINGTVNAIVQDGSDLKLELVAAKGTNHPGQNMMIISNATWKPELGMLVHGGDSTLVIQKQNDPTTVHHYKRVMYTRLVEDFGY